MDTTHATIIVKNSTDWYTLIAIALSPLIAVLVTMWIQKQRERKNAKLRLFFTLVARRGSLGVDSDFVDSLNLIDLVFADEPQIRLKWNEYFSALQVKDSRDLWDRKLNELLYSVAETLGYEIKGEAIEKFYIPQGHADSNEEWVLLRRELLRVLKETKSLNLLANPEKSE